MDKLALIKSRMKSAALHIGGALLLLIALFYAPNIRQIDNRLNDMAMQSHEKIGSPDIVILEIPDRTKDDAGNLPLSRDYLADVLENIAKIRPQKILFDGVLVADGLPAHDQRLAQIIKNLGPEKIAIGGLGKTETQPETLPNPQFSGASTIFNAAFHPDEEGLHRKLTAHTMSDSTLVNPSRWLAGEASNQAIIIDQGFDPDSYLRLPISEFKGQADLDLIDKIFIIGETTDLAQAKIHYPSAKPISRATYIALGTDTVLQARTIVPLDKNIQWMLGLALSVLAATLVLALNNRRYRAYAYAGGMGAIVIISLASLRMFDMLMQPLLCLAIWNGAALIALAFRHHSVERILAYAKGDLSAEEANIWRDMAFSKAPAFLLGVDKIKRINAAALALGVDAHNAETFSALRDALHMHADDEAKTISLTLNGETHVFAFTHPVTDKAFIHLELLPEAEAEAIPDRFASVFEKDALTKCKNKIGFEKAINALAQQKTPYAILSIALLGQASMRQLYGHEAADRLLIKVAERFKNLLREGDAIARLNEDDFTIIISGKQSDHYLTAVQKMFETALGNNLRIDGHVMAIGVCAGFAQSDQCDAVMDAAEKAKQLRVQQFKAKGRAIAQIENVAA